LRLKAISVRTHFWRPGTDHIQEIISSIGDIVEDGDIVTISEKAISTASGYMVDESQVKAGKLAKLLASVWMRKIWGGPLGKLTKLREKTLERLRGFPLIEGASHKETALRYVGFLQALRHYSEGGIDASNLPFAYVSLPLRDPVAEADRIKMTLEDEIGCRLSVMIVDGDTSYSWRNLHLAPRHIKVPGLVHLGGFLTFVVGRMLDFKSRSTPIALSGVSLNPEWALTLANVAHRVRGHGAGRTVWDMSESLGTDITGVNWEMLDGIRHAPIVILREIITTCE
jgi:F420-0:gamma-glutamyl ligase-like protein